MINITLKESNQDTDLSALTLAPIEVEEKLDDALDSGTLRYMVTELKKKGLNEALAGYTVKKLGVAGFDFVGMDSRALDVSGQNGTGVYSHQVALTEPTKLLQGAMIDGIGITQPEVLFIGEPVTVTVEGEISTQKMENEWHHDAYGFLTAINIVRECQIESLEPSANIPANISFEGKEITWSASWRDDTEDYGEEKYKAQITYTTGSGATLLDVISRLLQVATLNDERFTLTTDEAVLNALKSVVCPQYRWNTQTSLFECLWQLGAVVDAMPRLVADSSGAYTVVTFDFVNKTRNSVAQIDDGKTNAVGENLDENQYNTALSSVVENLREQ